MKKRSKKKIHVTCKPLNKEMAHTIHKWQVTPKNNKPRQNEKMAICERFTANIKVNWADDM